MTWPQESHWRERAFAWLSVSFDSNARNEQADALRFIFRHLREGPEIALVVLGGLPDEIEFERLLEAGAIESAAALLLARMEFGYMISRSPLGQVRVTVVLPGIDEETDFACNDEKLALVGCVVKALALLDDRPGETSATPPPACH